jgi:hypothetical protein
MLSTITGVIISLFSVFLYVGLGMYVLTKNPRERTNFIFVLLMLVFIIWYVGTYNIGIITENAPIEEILLSIKLQLSDVIIFITIFVLLDLILTIDASTLENNVFLLTPQKKPDFFLYSAVFGIAGVYALLRHYMTSKYRQQEQANIIILGSFLAILVAVVSNIILPLFFNIYLLPLSSFAPALMGVFFAYAVYKYGLYKKAVPEISITSFCGVECKLCSQYLNKKCSGCRLPEMPVYDLISGQTYFVKDEGYEKFLDAIKSSIYGLILSTMKPQHIREKYGLITTPLVWISDEAFEDGVNPKNLKRLATVIINFMKQIENAVILLDGIDSLILINGFDNVQHVVQTLCTAAQTTNNILIIQTKMEEDELHRMKPLYFKRGSLKQEPKKKRIKYDIK